MERPQVLKKVQDILEEVWDSKQPAEDVHLQDDLGADSLGLIELTMALEEGFGIDIPDRDAEKITTVGETVDYLMAIESVREQG